MDPFKDLVFEGARKASTTKRTLQSLPEKEKNGSADLTNVQIQNISQRFEPNTPKGLERNFFSNCISRTGPAWE